MTRLVLVRHGQAEAGWAEDLDPGLSDLGRVQAEAVASVIAADEPMTVIASPLRRARQTAAPLCEMWSTMARIERRVGEIPSPTKVLSERAAWLSGLFDATWDQLDKSLRVWKLDVLDTLLNLPDDTVVFTHYLAINVAVGEATGDRRLICFAPDYCSRTTFEVVDSRLRLVDLGDEASTIIT